MSRTLTNENLTISMQRLGASREPLLVIDTFLREPELLVRQAQSSTEWEEASPGGYPGIRAGLPSNYARQTLRRLDPIIRSRIFDSPRKLGKFECSFSMVTKELEALHASQKLPHIDVANENRIAILHYLCGAQFGGTAFFRQDATGLEKVTAKDRGRYLTARKSDMNNLAEKAGFPNEQTDGYTKIGSVEAQFNRLVIYRSCILHSGIISAPEELSDDPNKGRLTANFFVDYIAPA